MGLIANPEKEGGGRVVRKAARLLKDAGREALADVATAELARLVVPTLADAESVARACDLLLVFGGDGTMLRMARETAGTAAPLLGVNLGTLGFLTATPANGIEHALREVWSGKCLVDARQLIEARGQGPDGPIRELALNDFVISHGMVPRLIELEVNVDGDLLTSYRGDGLIVSSPTGSTAYSLAAGGAVVSPQAEVFALTPICPHTLSGRAVIVSLKATITVRLLSERVETFLAADGHTRAKLRTGDAVRFRRSRHAAHLVRLPCSSFFDTLRQKLNWSGSPL